MSVKLAYESNDCESNFHEQNDSVKKLWKSVIVEIFSWRWPRVLLMAWVGGCPCPVYGSDAHTLMVRQ